MSDNIKNPDMPTEGADNATQGANAALEETQAADKKTATQGKKSGGAGVYVHNFKTPFEYEKTKYTTLNFYFEKLTGRDMIAIETEMQENNEYALDPLVSRNFQCKMASKAAGIGSDALEAMPIQEFNKITTAARNFLIDTGF